MCHRLQTHQFKEGEWKGPVYTDQSDAVNLVFTKMFVSYEASSQISIHTEKLSVLYLNTYFALTELLAQI